MASRPSRPTPSSANSASSSRNANNIADADDARASNANSGTTLDPTRLAADMVRGLLDSPTLNLSQYSTQYQNIMSTLNNIIKLYDPSGVVSSSSSSTSTSTSTSSSSRSSHDTFASFSGSERSDMTSTSTSTSSIEASSSQETAYRGEMSPSEGMSRTMAYAQADITPSGGSELSPHEIMELTQNIKDEEAHKRPLVAATVPLSVLRSEYTSPAFVSKIDWLAKHGWTGLRRSRGDGDCFYRSIAFAYVERIMQASDISLAAATSLSTLENGVRNLEAVGFEVMAFEDFYECLRDMILNVVQPDAHGNLMTPMSMLERFQDVYVSNSIVVFLRLLTSAYIRINADDFMPFLFDPETFEPVEIRRFCESQVEATGKEADHPQVQALSKALNVPINVAYVDGSGSGSAGSHSDDGKVDFVKFEVASPDGAEPITLLYRPGHYDILERKSVTVDERAR